MFMIKGAKLKKLGGKIRYLKEKPTRKEWIKILDDLAKEVVYARDGHRSVKSGETGRLNPSHVYPKGRYTRMRWELDNLLTLTWDEHLQWWHKNPIEAGNWFKEKYPDRYIYLRRRSQIREGGSIDYRAIELYLKSQLKKYE